MSSNVATKLLLRRGLSSEVPVLDIGELGLDTDTFTIRVGNGTSNPPKIISEASTGPYNFATMDLVVHSLSCIGFLSNSLVFTDSQGRLTTTGTSAFNLSQINGTFNSTSVSLFNSGINASSTTFWAGNMAWRTIDLTTCVTNVLPIANGGTGATTAPAARSSLGAAGITDANVFTANNQFNEGVVVGNATGSFLGAGSVNASSGFYINGVAVNQAPVTTIDQQLQIVVFSSNPLFARWFPCIYNSPVELELFVMFTQLLQSPSINVTGIANFQIFRDGVLLISPACTFSISPAGQINFPYTFKFVDSPSIGWHYYIINIIGLTNPVAIGHRTLKCHHPAPLITSLGPPPNTIP